MTIVLRRALSKLPVHLAEPKEHFAASHVPQTLLLDIAIDECRRHVRMIVSLEGNLELKVLVLIHVRGEFCGLEGIADTD